MNDGKLKLLYQEVQSQLQWIEGIGLNDRRDREAIKRDLSTAMNKLVIELKFVHSGKLMRRLL